METIRVRNPRNGQFDYEFVAPVNEAISAISQNVMRSRNLSSPRVQPNSSSSDSSSPPFQ